MKTIQPNPTSIMTSSQSINCLHLFLIKSFHVSIILSVISVDAFANQVVSLLLIHKSNFQSISVVTDKCAGKMSC